MRTIYIDCIGGIAGDMLLGALVDAGADRDEVVDALRALDVSGWSLDFHEVERGGIRATHAVVTTDEASAARNYADIRRLIEESSVPDRIADRALRTFEALAHAEATIHGREPEEVHFHEVGGLDAIVDVVGTCAAIENISAETIVASPVPVGRGTVDSAHGVLPVPAPATIELLRGAPVVTGGEGETATPTGAALLRANCTSFGVMPPMRPWAIGYGAGTRETASPNVVRVLVGETEVEMHPETIDLIETNLDDMNPELIPYAIERLLERGALDAWTTPAYMKKGRTGVVLSVLGDRLSTPGLLDILFRETTTLGVRIFQVHREIADRKEVQVMVGGHRVRVKVGSRDGERVNAAPEYEDAADVARATGMALKDVYRAALQALPEEPG